MKPYFFPQARSDPEVSQIFLFWCRYAGGLVFVDVLLIFGWGNFEIFYFSGNQYILPGRPDWMPPVAVFVWARCPSFETGKRGVTGLVCLIPLHRLGLYSNTHRHIHTRSTKNRSYTSLNASVLVCGVV